MHDHNSEIRMKLTRWANNLDEAEEDIADGHDSDATRAISKVIDEMEALYMLLLENKEV